jgi:hypothetical protein
MNKIIRLTFAIAVLLTFALWLLPDHAPNQILISAKDMQAPTVAMSGYNTYFIRENYCIITKFPVVNPVK